MERDVSRRPDTGCQDKEDLITTGSDFPPPFSPEFVTLTRTFGTRTLPMPTRLFLHARKMKGTAPRLLLSALKVIYKDCKNLGTMIQLKMDTCVPDEAIRMCLAAGYTYKAITVREPRKNRVRQTTSPGVVQAEGEGAGGRMWQWSFNPYADTPVITDSPYTTAGVTTVNTGKSKIEVFFRWQLVYHRKIWRMEPVVFRNDPIKMRQPANKVISLPSFYFYSYLTFF